jgi:S-formylglutathione hydrolase FrmB
VVAALACTTALLAPAAAHAASAPHSERFDVPSLQGNVDINRVQLNPNTNGLTAWVRYPAGYDDDPNRKWPVLYLLHGWEDNSSGWMDPYKGSLDAILPPDFDGVVVMPEGGKEWFVNWYDDKLQNPGHNWSDYLLDEVVPFMEDHLRIKPGRANHAIGGLSMGGFGALRAAATLPTYFGYGLSFSGLLDDQDAKFGAILSLAQITHPGYPSVFGPLPGPYATTLNPIKTARDYRLSRLSIDYGTPAVATLWSLNLRTRGLATLELGAQLHARDFLDAVKGNGADVYSNNRNNGSHDWHWWRMDLVDAINRGLWKNPPVTETSQATSWEYDTMARHGNAWGLGFKFAVKPTVKISLIRRGQLLIGQGAGTIRIAGGAADADASGNGTLANCTYTLKLPFAQTLPSGC